MLLVAACLVLIVLAILQPWALASQRFLWRPLFAIGLDVAGGATFVSLLLHWTAHRLGRIHGAVPKGLRIAAWVCTVIAALAMATFGLFVFS